MPGRPELSDERKLVTVLFADVVGSTARVYGLDPEDAHARLRPALDAMMGTDVATMRDVEKAGPRSWTGALCAHRSSDTLFCVPP